MTTAPTTTAVMTRLRDRLAAADPGHVLDLLRE